MLSTVPDVQMPGIDQLLDDAIIGQGGHVPQVADLVAGNLPQYPSHDLSGSSLWERGSRMDHFRSRDRSDPFPDWGAAWKEQDRMRNS